jgi:hypothetical protein
MATKEKGTMLIHPLDFEQFDQQPQNEMKLSPKPISKSKRDRTKV